MSGGLDGGVTGHSQSISAGDSVLGASARWYRVDVSDGDVFQMSMVV